MDEFIKVAKKSEIAVGQMKEYRISGKTVAIANIAGEFLAFDGICTHAHCALAGGYLDGYTLTCYCHGAQFDIKSGSVLAPPAPEPVSVYEVKLDDSDILLKI
ncbi:hypothetical protein A3E42_02020 [Candidatus Gottesmanbacteria bacterium RIFCSPHIGHO2_12_FULL_40_13]|nr:MAG: hypothetical protein A3E42_02020 [Candidatus Gottesmanbacteria bacterium RIFCSPHIGHO2_12_FULL_40_13]